MIKNKSTESRSTLSLLLFPCSLFNSDSYILGVFTLVLIKKTKLRSLSVDQKGEFSYLLPDSNGNYFSWELKLFSTFTGDSL